MPKVSLLFTLRILMTCICHFSFFFAIFILHLSEIKINFSELDDTIGDLMLRINKRESYIILKLVKYINKHAASIFNAIQLCAELDT